MICRGICMLIHYDFMQIPLHLKIGLNLSLVGESGMFQCEDYGIQSTTKRGDGFKVFLLQID